MLGALLMMANNDKALIASFMAATIVFVLCCIPFDDIKTEYEKRQDEIEREFSNVISKLTLLTGAGMDVTKAWKQTAQSRSSTLYLEMRNVNNKMDNGVSAYEAYNDFIHRCNNKYTSKLATSIMQNLSKGNEQICELFREITDESWNERRQYAKRKGEIAQSKLMLPTILMFIGIILMVMAPIVNSFTSIGM